MKTKTDSKRLAIIVTIDQYTRFDGHTSSWITAYVAEVKPDAIDGFQYASSYGDDGALGKIQLRSLLSSDYKTRDASPGNVTCRDISHAQAWELEPIVKRLRMIESRMTKLDEKFGNCTDFTQSVLRFAAAIGADAIITRTSDAAFNRSGNRYHVVGTSQGSFNIGCAINEWYEAHAPIAKEQA